MRCELLCRATGPFGRALQGLPASWSVHSRGSEMSFSQKRAPKNHSSASAPRRLVRKAAPRAPSSVKRMSIHAEICHVSSTQRDLFGPRRGGGRAWAFGGSLQRSSLCPQLPQPVSDVLYG